MTTRLQRIWERATASSPAHGLRFDRPLLLLQSDDWGRVGVRDREGWEQLRAAGVQLGEAPYDFYSLETAEDLHRLSEVLARHRDSVGRHPSMVMNFIMANLDFDRCFASTARELPLVPLTDGLPGQWQRPHLFDAYRQGVQEGLFFPALHGLTHFCAKSIVREVAADGERADLIRKLWRAQTPYIYWRMPWIGYEYWDAELKPKRRFLALDDQRAAIHRAAEIFQAFFASPPFSACAPGYRANVDTRTAWIEAGIRVAQNGPGERKRPHLDQRGMLHTFRTIEMEPAISDCDLENLARQVEGCFQSGIPAIVSTHSINFHSTVRDFRTPTLALLDEFLTVIEKQWPDLLYVNDADLFRIASEGFYLTQGKRMNVAVTTVEAKN